MARIKERNYSMTDERKFERGEIVVFNAQSCNADDFIDERPEMVGCQLKVTNFFWDYLDYPCEWIYSVENTDGYHAYLSGNQLLPLNETDLFEHTESDKAIQPERYQGANGVDLIAKWSQLMAPDEFRRTMYSHIDKYLFRYHKKNGKQDFKKAMEFMKRLEEWEHETGHFGGDS